MNRDPSEVHLGGQVPFVTGGGRGLGRAFAEALAAAGAAAAAVARSAGQVEESAAGIDTAGEFRRVQTRSSRACRSADFRPRIRLRRSQAGGLMSALRQSCEGRG